VLAKHSIEIWKFKKVRKTPLFAPLLNVEFNDNVLNVELNNTLLLNVEFNDNVLNVEFNNTLLLNVEFSGHFLRHLHIKCIFLPRQARDKHRES
jgi:hypothetical protein